MAALKVERKGTFLFYLKNTTLLIHPKGEENLYDKNKDFHFRQHSARKKKNELQDPLLHLRSVSDPRRLSTATLGRMWRCMQHDVPVPCDLQCLCPEQGR